jgi:drug/metabolite transporter (DMT)-like permease
MYGLIAAFLIASRDIFTKHFSKKYTTCEHLLYYYVLCGFFIVSYCIYKKYYLKESVRMIEKDDWWKYILMALVTVTIISPCETLSLKHCKTPGQSKSVVNLNTIFVFFLGMIFLKDKFSLKTLFGIALTIIGLYFVM